MVIESEGYLHLDEPQRSLSSAALQLRDELQERWPGVSSFRVIEVNEGSHTICDEMTSPFEGMLATLQSDSILQRLFERIREILKRVVSGFTIRCTDQDTFILNCA